MKFLNKLNPEWLLRISTGIMYLYSGQDLVRHPGAWVWALPYWAQQLIESSLSIDLYLKIQGGIEIFMAIVFFAWFLKPDFVKWIAIFSALEMLGIIILAFFPFRGSNFLITFRDIGLFGGSLALATLLSKKQKE